MVGGLLSKHPEINYYFQPFSSTEVHRTQYETWGAGENHPETESFIRSLREGHIEHNFIASDWFDRFSEYKPDCAGCIGIIKETKLHTKIGWLKSTFPGIEIYGIWRDPRAVLCSLVRNDFHREWYGEAAFQATCTLVREEECLEMFIPFLGARLSEEARMALIFSARTQLMMSELRAENWLVYEDVLADPDQALNRFCKTHGLNEFRFSEWRDRDYNVIGLPYLRQDLWKTCFTGSVLAEIEKITGSIENVPNAA